MRTVPGTPFTPREMSILPLLAAGLTNQQIGQELYLACDTIKTHLARMLAKSCTRTRAHLVAESIRRGWIE